MWQYYLFIIIQITYNLDASGFGVRDAESFHPPGSFPNQHAAGQQDPYLSYGGFHNENQMKRQRNF